MSFVPFDPEQADCLGAVLSAREARAERQQALLQQYVSPLISFTLNIPGPTKNSEAYRRVHDAGLRELQLLLERCGYPVLYDQVCETAAGQEALLVVVGDAVQVKLLCVHLEAKHPLGRLFDFDVLESNGDQIHREAVGVAARSCLICGQPAHLCARSRRHHLSELLAVIDGMIGAYPASS